MGSSTSKYNHEEVVVKVPKDKFKKEAYSREKRLLTFSRLRVGEEIFIEDVEIDYFGKNYMHMISCRQDVPGVEKDNIVIIHGFGGTGSNFFKMFYYLVPKFMLTKFHF